MEPGRTPMRDALGLNDPDALLAEGESRREARARDAAARGELRAGGCAEAHPGLADTHEPSAFMSCERECW